MRCLNCEYGLDGLVEPRCPECGTAFEFDNPRTYAKDDGGKQRTHAIAASFAGAFLGWVLAYTAHVFYQIYIGGFGYLTGVAFWRFWTSATVFVWWILCVVPLLSFRSVLRRLRNPVFAMIVGAVHGAIGYFVVIAWVAGIWWYTISFAAIVGAVSGLIVSIVLRWRRARCADPPRGLAWALAGAPPCLLLVWLGLIWPTIAWFSPATQDKFGSQTSKEQAVIRVLSKVTVGDPYQELHRLLPDRFPAVGPVGLSVSTGSSSSFEYEVVVRDGVITKVEYRSLVGK